MMQTWGLIKVGDICDDPYELVRRLNASEAKVVKKLRRQWSVAHNIMTFYASDSTAPTNTIFLPSATT